VTIAELRQRWQERAGEWRRLHVSVDGAALADELLADLEQLERTDEERLYTPTQAAARTGFHPESIARMVRQGRVPNHGTKHRPRVKLSELPKKAPKVAKSGQAGASSAAADTTSIARDAIALRIGR
jgi:hypothetical protein